MSEEIATNEENAINNDIAETVPEPFECHICGKVAKNSTGLKIHLNTHNLKKRIKGRAAPIKTAPPAYEREALALSPDSQTKRATQPWRPVSQLFSIKIPGMRPRWVRKDLLEKRIEEGWQPRLSDSKNRLEAPEKTIIDGVPLSKYVMKRGMILCDIPEALAQSREDYYRRLNDGGLRSQNAEFDAGTGGNAYGDISVGRE